MDNNEQETRSLALTPTWSVATVLTVFVAVSLLVERSIHRLSNWLRKTNRKPLLAALEKMKEELMLLGFISLLLTATSRMIANICIPSKFYNSAFAPCTRSQIDEQMEENGSEKRKLLMASAYHGYEPFVSYEGLEQLHRFIFVMAVTHISYSCLTMLLAIVKNHHLSLKYDFHSYMVRSMEEEFQRIVGVSGPLWGFVVGFMLFNIKGSNLYFWIAIIPVSLVLLVGTKLQHVIATLALENAGIAGFFPEAKLRPRDELFWFNKPELLLSLIHFILFQNAFELASFFWFWWQFGYDSCFIRNHLLLYLRLILGFAGQFLCSYSTLPLYALVTQMGTNYKAALIPQRIRETIHGWGKAARRKRKHGMFPDDSTIHTDTSTVLSIEEDDQLIDVPEVELQPVTAVTSTPSPIVNETSSRAATPLLRPSASISSAHSSSKAEVILRCSSMPSGR
ncbi:MLO-like protein [Vigna angularis]|uniref:MLO-like protein n=1 Tax=Phaseolus angularis TaxID=3914 RepID=A0A8T0JI41_PHAAN|nr:MLO-like protein [Vigna angularis]